MNAFFVCCQIAESKLSQLAPLPGSQLRYSEPGMDVQAKNCLGTNRKYLLKGTRYPLECLSFGH